MAKYPSQLVNIPPILSNSKHGKFFLSLGKIQSLQYGRTNYIEQNLESRIDFQVVFFGDSTGGIILSGLASGGKWDSKLTLNICTTPTGFIKYLEDMNTLNILVNDNRLRRAIAVIEIPLSYFLQKNSYNFYKMLDIDQTFDIKSASDRISSIGKINVKISTVFFKIFEEHCNPLPITANPYPSNCPYHSFSGRKFSPHHPPNDLVYKGVYAKTFSNKKRFTESQEQESSEEREEGLKYSNLIKSYANFRDPPYQNTTTNIKGYSGDLFFKNDGNLNGSNERRIYNADNYIKQANNNSSSIQSQHFVQQRSETERMRFRNESIKRQERDLKTSSRKSKREQEEFSSTNAKNFMGDSNKDYYYKGISNINDSNFFKTQIKPKIQDEKQIIIENMNFEENPYSNITGIKIKLVSFTTMQKNFYKKLEQGKIFIQIKIPIVTKYDESSKYVISGTKCNSFNGTSVELNSISKHRLEVNPKNINSLRSSVFIFELLEQINESKSSLLAVGTYCFAYILNSPQRKIKSNILLENKNSSKIQNQEENYVKGSLIFEAKLIISNFEEAYDEVITKEAILNRQELNKKIDEEILQKKFAFERQMQKYENSRFRPETYIVKPPYNFSYNKEEISKINSNTTKINKERNLSYSIPPITQKQNVFHEINLDKKIETYEEELDSQEESSLNNMRQIVQPKVYYNNDPKQIIKYPNFKPIAQNTNLNHNQKLTKNVRKLGDNESGSEELPNKNEEIDEDGNYVNNVSNVNLNQEEFISYHNKKNLNQNIIEVEEKLEEKVNNYEQIETKENDEIKGNKTITNEKENVMFTIQNQIFEGQKQKEIKEIQEIKNIKLQNSVESNVAIVTIQNSQLGKGYNSLQMNDNMIEKAKLDNSKEFVKKKKVDGSNLQIISKPGQMDIKKKDKDFANEITQTRILKEEQIPSISLINQKIEKQEKQENGNQARLFNTQVEEKSLYIQKIDQSKESYRSPVVIYNQIPNDKLNQIRNEELIQENAQNLNSHLAKLDNVSENLKHSPVIIYNQFPEPLKSEKQIMEDTFIKLKSQYEKENVNKSPVFIYNNIPTSEQSKMERQINREILNDEYEERNKELIQNQIIEKENTERHEKMKNTLIEENERQRKIEIENLKESQQKLYNENYHNMKEDISKQIFEQVNVVLKQNQIEVQERLNNQIERKIIEEKNLKQSFKEEVKKKFDYNIASGLSYIQLNANSRRQISRSKSPEILSRAEEINIQSINNKQGKDLKSYRKINCILKSEKNQIDIKPMIKPNAVSSSVNQEKEIKKMDDLVIRQPDPLKRLYIIGKRNEAPQKEIRSIEIQTLIPNQKSERNLTPSNIKESNISYSIKDSQVPPPVYHIPRDNAIFPGSPTVLVPGVSRGISYYPINVNERKNEMREIFKSEPLIYPPSFIVGPHPVIYQQDIIRPPLNLYYSYPNSYTESRMNANIPNDTKLYKEGKEIIQQNEPGFVAINEEIKDRNNELIQEKKIIGNSLQKSSIVNGSRVFSGNTVKEQSSYNEIICKIVINIQKISDFSFELFDQFKNANDKFSLPFILNLLPFSEDSYISKFFKPLNYSFQLTETNSAIKCIWEIPVTINDKIKKYLDSKLFILNLFIDPKSEINKIKKFSEPIGICKVSLFELLSNNNSDIISKEYNITAQNNDIIGKIAISFHLELIENYDKGSLGRDEVKTLAKFNQLKEEPNEYIGLKIFLDCGKEILCPPDSTIFCEIIFPNFEGNFAISNSYMTQETTNLDNPKFNHTLCIAIPKLQTNCEILCKTPLFIKVYYKDFKTQNNIVTGVVGICKIDLKELILNTLIKEINSWFSIMIENEAETTSTMLNHGSLKILITSESLTSQKSVDKFLSLANSNEIAYSEDNKNEIHHTQTKEMIVRKEQNSVAESEAPSINDIRNAYEIQNMKMAESLSQINEYQKMSQTENSIIQQQKNLNYQKDIGLLSKLEENEAKEDELKQEVRKKLY